MIQVTVLYFHRHCTEMHFGESKKCGESRIRMRKLGLPKVVKYSSPSFDHSLDHHHHHWCHIHTIIDKNEYVSYPANRGEGGIVKLKEGVHLGDKKPLIIYCLAGRLDGQVLMTNIILSPWQQTSVLGGVDCNLLFTIPYYIPSINEKI